MQEHVILVAFQVPAETREKTHEIMVDTMHTARKDATDNNIDLCWWVAENDRTDGSDNMSATFVPYEPQEVVF